MPAIRTSIPCTRRDQNRAFEVGWWVIYIRQMDEIDPAIRRRLFGGRKKKSARTVDAVGDEHIAPTSPGRGVKKATQHALLRFLERGTKVSLDKLFLKMVSETSQPGKSIQLPKDSDFLYWMSSQINLRTYRKTLNRQLVAADVFHRDEKAAYKVLSCGLVAVMDVENRMAISVITRETALKTVPKKVLQASGVWHMAAPTMPNKEDLYSQEPTFFQLDLSADVLGHLAHVEERLRKMRHRYQIDHLEGEYLRIGIWTRDALIALRKMDGIEVCVVPSELPAIGANADAHENS